MNFLELRPMVLQHTQFNRMSIIGEGIVTIINVTKVWTVFEGLTS